MLNRNQNKIETSINLDDFKIQKECSFEGEMYSVRDNGAVLRHSPEGKRLRSVDNKWTLGNTNESNPYLHIAGVRVHRIVATAFHGEPPDPKYVVDHIDSNCRNNRPENLRWLTRLENTLKNPATRKKIEFLCGSVEAFLANPAILNSMNLSPNMAWMKAVTPEEAENCKLRVSIWANSKNIPTGSKTNRRGAFDKRVFKPLHKWEAGLAGEPGLDFAETPICGQYMWAGSFFPMCPNEFGISTLESYFQNIKIGELFSYGDSSPRLIVNMVAKTKHHPAILVLCESSGSKPFALCAITLNEKGYFVHFVVGTHLDLEKARAAFEVEVELLNFSSDGYGGFR